MWRLNSRRQWYARHCQEPTLKAFLTHPLPPPASPWQQVPWLAADLEMTSLDAKTGHIVSLGWVAVNSGVISLASLKRLLVKPTVNNNSVTTDGVGHSATIHYLRDTDLSEGETLREALLTLAAAATGRVCVFHHHSLDNAFLNQAFKREFGIPWLCPSVDTLQLEWQRLKRRDQVVAQDDLRLSSCRHRYHLPAYPMHDASHDALACAELLIAWASHSKDKGPSLRQCLRWSP